MGEGGNEATENNKKIKFRKIEPFLVCYFVALFKTIYPIAVDGSSIIVSTEFTCIASTIVALDNRDSTPADIFHYQFYFTLSPLAPRSLHARSASTAAAVCVINY